MAKSVTAVSTTESTRLRRFGFWGLASISASAPPFFDADR